MENYIIEENVNMEMLTTYKIHGFVKKVVYPLNEESLVEIVKMFKRDNEKYIILGFGSNIIFKDLYYDGTIIKLTKITRLDIEDNIVNVSAGYSLIKLCLILKDFCLGGMEALSGIPGTIGGAICSNAGANNCSISEFVQEVRVLKNNEILILKNDDIKFGYRTSIFKNNNDYIILSVKLKLQKKQREDISKLMDIYSGKRRISQPLEYPNAGCVFKNPIGDSAGRLIDSLGLKNFKFNEVYVSDKHANFFVNKGISSGEDIINLIEIVKTKVKDEYGINLELEQEIIV